MSKRGYRVSIGEGVFEVAYTDTSVILIDSQTLTKIVIYYHPYHRKWYTDPNGNFIKRLGYISFCATAVFEYCERSVITGNLYIDALYCEKFSEEELDNYWQPAEYILTAYRMGNRRPFYEWRKRVMPEVAKDIATAMRERFPEAESTLSYIIYTLFGSIPLDYMGYMVTGYKYCANLLYGIFCRLEPELCIPVMCRPLCEIASDVFPNVCSNEREKLCIETEPIYQPIRRKQYGRK